MLQDSCIPRGLVLAIAFSIVIVGVTQAQDQQSSPESSPPYRPEIKALAERVLKNADKANCHSNRCTVLVANFTTSAGSTSILGMQLADSVSAELLSQGSDIQVVDRSRLRDYLELERIPSNLLKGAKAARWLASELEADAVVIGSMEEQTNHLRLSVELLSVSNEDKGPQEAVELFVPDLKGGLAPFEPYKAEPASSSGTASQDSTPPRAGSNGVGVPACIYCPAPMYTKRAHDEKFNGTVVMMTTVTQDGRATGISMIKGVPFGLNERAIEAVSKWQFKPATKGRTPVATLVPIHVTFRLN
jgi:TonB family protein